MNLLFTFTFHSSTTNDQGDKLRNMHLYKKFHLALVAHFNTVAMALVELYGKQWDNTWLTKPALKQGLYTVSLNGTWTARSLFPCTHPSIHLSPAPSFPCSHQLHVCKHLMSLAAKLCKACVQAVICSQTAPCNQLSFVFHGPLTLKCPLLPNYVLPVPNLWSAPRLCPVPSPTIPCVQLSPHSQMSLNTQPFTNVVPYSQKYWRSLNLAVWLQTGHSKILVEFKFGDGPSLA